MRACADESSLQQRDFDDAEPAADIGDATFTPLSVGLPDVVANLVPVEHPWTLVFVPDGFTAEDGDAYNDYVDAVLLALFTREPFLSDPLLRLAVNPIRTNVLSPSRYLRDATLGDLDPDERTSFGMTLGLFMGAIDGNKYAFWDLDRHQEFLDDLVRDEGMDDWDATMMVGNTPEFGGLRLGTMAGVNLGAPPWAAVHEIGHLMGLVDEYEVCAPPAEPDRTGSFRRPFVVPEAWNIAYSEHAIDVSNLWWRHHLPASWSSFRKETWDVADRRTDYPDVPDQFDAPGRPEVTDELIGMFEGTRRGRRYSWRAQWKCVMRADDHGFCVACADGIRSFLADHTSTAGSNP